MRPYFEEDGITIYHGDCREILSSIREVGTILTDPPYGISLEPRRGRTSAIAGDSRREAKALLWYVSRWAFHAAPADSAHFFFAGWGEPWTQEVLSEWFTVKACIVWVKNQFGLGYHTRPQHEICYLVHKGDPNPPEEARSDVWQYPRLTVPEHSCEKPTELISALLNYYPQEGLVVDPFMGSGTTLVCAKNANRPAIGIELEERYCEIAARRLSQKVLDFSGTSSGTQSGR